MYSIHIEKRALKQLKKLPYCEQEVIIRKVNTILGRSPFPLGKNPKKLVNKKAYRFRSGNYRVLYEVEGAVVKIYAIKKRSEAYR